MKFSYNWLRELVPGLDSPGREMNPLQLMRLITMKTAECEGALEQAGALLADASPARIVSVELIEGSHNRIANIDTDRFGSRTVLCGAPNCLPAHRTVYVPIGKKTIAGIESDGMLASAAELGIGDDHSGIVELEGPWDPRLIPDSVIEVDNKSLTHRPDLWGHEGMSREVAAITGLKRRDPVSLHLLPSPQSAPIHVNIADPALCPRYSALAFENVTVQPSPLWLQYRLHAIGLNSINNIVDVTNLIMSELAQPMHAFDRDRLQGDTIYVRPAKEGESIVALNDDTYRLNPANLVIADARGPVAIAGVIGGKDSAIDESTTRIVFESANFQAASVRKTSSSLKLRTDASMRFEKAQDPSTTVRALARAIELLQEVSPGIRLVGGLADVYTPAPSKDPVALPIDWLSRKLGRTVTEHEVTAILQSLEFPVARDVPGILSVSIPSWRATKDISRKEDLLEEVGRMVGYGEIEPAAPLVAATPPPSNPERMFQRRVRSNVASQGFTEIYNYSFISEEAAARFGWAPGEHLRVANPIASDQTLMRTSLLPGIVRNIEDNSRHYQSFRLFEIGREIHPAPAGGLPAEIPHLMAAVYAREGDGAEGLFELKRLAQCLVKDVQTWQTEPRPFEHPQRAALVCRGDQPLGRLFELHPKLGVEGRAAILNLDLKALESADQGAFQYKPPRRFPASSFDLSVVTPLREPVGAISKQLEQAAGASLVGIEFVRQYVGPPLPSDRRSVSFKITVGALDRTLSSDDVASIRNRLIEAMRQSGFDLRV